jgi:hypothetical protein
MQHLLASMLDQAKTLFETPKLRSIFNWSADLESKETSSSRFSKIKLAAFLRMDFPVCSTPNLNDCFILRGPPSFRHGQADAIYQEIKALLVYYETYYQPLTSVTLAGSDCLGLFERAFKVRFVLDRGKYP